MIGLQGPAYIVRRPHPELRGALADFFRAAGFGQVRDTEHGQFFVAGDTWGIKTVPNERHSGGTDLELVPVVHSTDLATTVARLRAYGLTPTSDSRESGWRIVEVRTPDGGVIAFSDREFELPEPGWVLPDTSRGTADLAGTRLVLRRAADVDTVAHFYSNVLALAPTNDPLTFHLGEGVLLQVTDGGRSRAGVRNKLDTPDCLMVRVVDFAAAANSLTSRGLTWLEQPETFFTGTTVGYTADPEGVVICIAERASYQGNSEDTAAYGRRRPLP